MILIPKRNHNNIPYSSKLAKTINYVVIINDEESSNVSDLFITWNQKCKVLISSCYSDLFYLINKYKFKKSDKILLTGTTFTTYDEIKDYEAVLTLYLFKIKEEEKILKEEEKIIINYKKKYHISLKKYLNNDLSFLSNIASFISKNSQNYYHELAYFHLLKGNYLNKEFILEKLNSRYKETYNYEQLLTSKDDDYYLSLFDYGLFVGGKSKKQRDNFLKKINGLFLSLKISDDIVKKEISKDNVNKIDLYLKETCLNISKMTSLKVTEKKLLRGLLIYIRERVEE